MKKAFKLLAILLVALTVVTGCTSKEPEPEVKEKVFTYAIGGEPSYLDAAIAGDAVTNYVFKQLYEGLFSVNSDGSLSNELCESYTISDDGLVYTFKLIDANWSDGQPIKAQDFVYGMLRSIAYGPADAYYSTFITKTVKGGDAAAALLAEKGQCAIADLPEMGIKALDDKTLEITLAQKTPYFLQLTMQNTFYPVREDYAVELESAWANDPKVPTNGAFTIESISEKEEIVLVKNPNYRLADQVTLDKIVYKIMTDADAQLVAFQNGEVDFATGVPASVSKTYADSAELFKIDPYVVNYFVTINSSSSVDALKDVRVRKALSLAVNRADILQVLDAGSTQYELYGFVPKGISGVSGDFREEQDAVLKLSDYDPETAKALLADAGYNESNPLKLTYSYNSSTMHTDVAQVLQSNWKDIGVEVELKTAEIRVFFDERTNGNFELARHANSADYLDPMIYLEMYLAEGQGTNKAVDDPTYDAMVKAANAESDPDKRMELLHAAENYFVNEMAYVIPLFGYTTPMLLKEGVTGIATAPDGSTVLRFVKLPE